MNEFEHLRRAFPQQDAPTPEAAAAARQQVEALIREAKSDKRRAVRVARAGWVGTAVTAATAVVAVAGLGGALLAGGGGDGDAVVPGAGGTTTAPRLVTAAQVLIAAALRQEVDEKVSGKFFRVRSLQVSATTRVGNPKYTLERRSITESWMPMKPGVESWFGWVNLAYRPATVNDVAKWQAQGSPQSWKLPYEVDPISTKDGEPVVNKMSFRDVPPGYYLTGDRPLTAQQIAALPTDPIALRGVLARSVGPRETADERNYAVFAAAGRLLFELPSPPKLRGAALRVLAALPGTQIRAGVKDPIGRVGTEITLTADLSKASGGRTFLFAGGASYIIDAATGRLLSSSVAGPKPGSTVVLESGWTDDRPTPPSPAVR
ncbi:CU044_5270 family protein [Kribbella sp. NPDC026596]|uniref:CU044_5270 family protein n=1 Tax=Kribbella sp. NPDC026596 TaxID=3155122 RepID=UPI00340B08B0